MDVLPSNIMLDIFSRVPVKCLTRFRCVSKLLGKYIDDPYLAIIHYQRGFGELTPIMFHRNDIPIRNLPKSLCFHLIESNIGIDSVFETKRDYLFEFGYEAEVTIRGSCNGLLYLSQETGDVVTSLVVIHPLRKQCYELPPLTSSFNIFIDSCGLGFDDSTNTFKMVCVCVLLEPFQWITMVHVLGTNSWRKIPQVPSYSIEGEAVFSNGYLLWLTCIYETFANKRAVIWFDVNKEEFGLTDYPKTVGERDSFDHLVNLNGEAGLACVNGSSRTTEVWVLKQKEWVLHCSLNNWQFNSRHSWQLNNEHVKVVGCWNKNGDILVLRPTTTRYELLTTETGRQRLLFYNLKSGSVDWGKGDGAGIIMYTNSLFSINPWQYGISTKSHSIRSITDLRKSCHFFCGSGG